MYGENGTQIRTELAALLRQHRVMHRLGADSPADRAEVGVKSAEVVYDV
jgi:hypothetical protein